MDLNNIEIDDTERGLTHDENNLLKQFQENDEELEKLAGELNAALSTLKNTAE